MKICIIGDVHWSTYSSIVNNRGTNFSVRLENLIRSINWVEQISKEKGCEEEIFLGDFFDKPTLTDEEISALSEIEWNNSARIRHFIVGNHESGIASLKYSSTKSLQFRNNVVEDTPCIYPLDDKTEVLFLPYIVEDNRKPLKEYLVQRNCNKKLFVASHNDIKGIQMGKFLSTTGFDMDDIEANCDLFINGHLHNGCWETDKVLNLGNLTGQNFNENALFFEHHIAILDTDTFEVEIIENPYAMNFYKIEVNKESHLKQFNKLKNQSVLNIRCLDTLEEQVRNILKDNPKVLKYKLVIYSEVTTSEGDISQLNCVDHLEQFKEFVLSREDIDDKKVFVEELAEVCK